MTTLEEFSARHAQAEARATELRGKITRAERWDQLFSPSEEAQADFQRNLVDAWRFYYGKDDPLVQYSVEPNPDGDIHKIIRSDSHSGYSTYQRLLNGDVAISYYTSDKLPEVNLITPAIGNIDHPFVESDIASIDWEVFRALGLPLLSSHLKGKPATQDWEDTMLHAGYIPQRIGHKLFPDYALDALVRLREEHPQIIVKA